MNSKQLLYVITVAHEGSFSRAADTLNISQPSLSQYIKKIEREIGLELFDRTNNDVRITDAGRVYIEAGRKILDLEHQMENAFTDLASNKTGSLIIGAAPYRAASMLPTIASSFQKLHPGMHLIVREGTTAELIDGMEHGEYDLALTLLPIDEQQFKWEKVLEEELILAVPASYPVIPSVRLSSRKYPAIEVEKLKDQRLVMLTEGQFMQNQLNKLILTHGITLTAAAVVKSLEAQIEFVKAGVGMALMPSGIDRFCKQGEVLFYSFTEDLPKREVILMWQKNRQLSKTTEELKQLILSIDW